MKTAFVLFVIAAIHCAALAQNIAVLSHGAANTPDFRAGCPSNWPAMYFDLKDSKELPFGLKSPPWVVESVEEFRLRKANSEAAKDAWADSLQVSATQPKRDREDAIKQAIADLRTIRDSTGTLTAAQLSNAVRVIARALLAVIEHTLQ